MTKEQKRFTTHKGYCLWCVFKHSDHPSIEHCKKMITRALSRIRKGDSCHHCGHSKKEHTGKSYRTLVSGKNVLQLSTLCSHFKRGKDVEDFDSYCDCEVFL